MDGPHTGGGLGPVAPRVAVAARRQRLEWLGQLPKHQVLGLMKEAKALIFPSVWYEGFPMVIAEAYAVGLPVIASDLGSMSSLIDHRRTGLRFRPGDPGDLAAQVRWAVTRSEPLDVMRQAARAKYEAEYSAERNYHLLLEIYERAVHSEEQHVGR
jgi:glycosyltransferase involved in cell wall biosynthesis